MGGLTDTLHILFGNADGTLTDVGTVGGPIGRQSKFVSADFDDDGNADLVVVTADNSVGYMGQLLYFKGMGDGTFAAAARMAVDDFVDVRAADVDGNGTLDLIAAGLYEFAIYAGVGDGTFAPPTRFDLSETPEVIFVGDVTGDRLVDIVSHEYLHVQNTPPALRGSVLNLNPFGDVSNSSAYLSLDVDGDPTASSKRKNPRFRSVGWTPSDSQSDSAGDRKRQNTLTHVGKPSFLPQNQKRKKPQGFPGLS